MKKIISLTLLLLLNLPAFAQETVRPWMGILIEDNPKGIFVKEAMDKTPAKAAGLKSGDIILEVNSKPVKTTDELISTVANIGVGNIANVRYLENGKKEKLTKMELVARPDTLQLVENNLLNKKAPDISAKVLSKSKLKTFTLSKDKKKATVMMFWATWCGACASAQPALADFAKNNPDINVIAISSEEPKKIKKYIAQTKKAKRTNDQVLFIQGEGTSVDKDYFVPALPLFVIVDEKKIIKSVSVGVGPKLIEQLELAKKLTQN